MAIIRVSVVRVEAGRFDEFRAVMEKSAETLIPAIRELRGCLAYDAGADRETSSFTNVSYWESLADAKQMDTLAPMLESGKVLAGMGAVFERPIMNYSILWSAVDAVARPLQRDATS